MISVIVPYYNHKQEFLLALKSIYEQSYTDIELIVVDDGSDVPVNEKEIYALFPTAKIITHSINKGAPAARNTGKKQASGEYIIWWDADLIAQKDMLLSMKSALEEHNQYFYVYCNFIFGKKKFAVHEFSDSALKKQNYIHTTSLVRSSDAIEWDESITKFQDWDYWLTLAEQNKTGYWIDEYLFRVIQRKHGQGMSVWLPKIAYRFPLSSLPGIKNIVKKYKHAEETIKNKHGLK